MVGTWVKQWIQEEDHTYPQDKVWEITVVFQDDGNFAWKAKCKVEKPGEQKPGGEAGSIDQSATGTYSVEGTRSGFITYKFDEPKPKALDQLQGFFSVWPNQRRGQHQFYFDKDGLLELKSNMTFIHLKRLDVKQAEK